MNGVNIIEFYLMTGVRILCEYVDLDLKNVRVLFYIECLEIWTPCQAEPSCFA